MAMAAPAVAAMAPEIIGAGTAAAPAIAGMASAAPGIAGMFGPAAASLGASMLPAAAGAAPLGMATAAPGVAGLFGLPSFASAVGATTPLVSSGMLGKIGMNMLGQSMQQPQQQPMPMASPRPQSQPAPPAGIQGMLNQPAQGMHGGAQDVMQRLRMMGF